MTSFDEKESLHLKGGTDLPHTKGSCGDVCPFGPPTDTMDNDCSRAC